MALYNIQTEGLRSFFLFLSASLVEQQTAEDKADLLS
jgi:hypothetical protein